MRAARAEAQAYVQRIRDDVAAGRYLPRPRKCGMCGEPLSESRFNGFCSRRCWDFRMADLKQQEEKRQRELWLIYRYGWGTQWRGVASA